MVQKIKTRGKILTDGAEVIDPKREKDLVHKIIIDLKDTIRENNLVYLTAPQIGYNKRILVINFNNDLRTFINPIITKMKGFTFQQETCNSIPKKRFIVPRASSVDIIYTTPLGQYQNRTLLGLAATTIQHAIEHLDGTLISLNGLEIDDDFINASDEEKEEILKMYKESLVGRQELADKAVKEDSLAQQTDEAINFMVGVETGEVKLEKDEKEQEESKNG